MRPGVPSLRALGGALDEDSRRFLFGYAIALPALLIPLATTPIVPGLDFPFHLAIADMLGKASDPSSPYASFYAPRHWPPLPSLPWLLLAWLGHWLGPIAALKGLLALAIGGVPLSVAALARAFRVSVTPALLAGPLGYGLALHYGFFGYTLSLPIFFALMAALVRVVRPDGTAPRPGALVLVSALATLSFFLHLESYALAMGLSALLLLASRKPLAQTVAVAAALCPSAALFLLWQRTSAAAGAPPSLWGALQDLLATRRAEMGDLTVWRELVRQLDGLRVHLLRGFKDGHNLVASTLLVATMLAFALASRAKGLKAPADAPLSRLRVLAVVGALFAYLILPHHWDAHEAMSLSPRLAPIVVGLAIAVLPIAPSWTPTSGLGRGLARAAATLPLLLTVTYAAVVARHYKSYAVEVGDFLHVMSRIPPGGRLVGLVGSDASRVMNIESLPRSLPSLYVALRPHDKSMVALRYCGMRHVPCSLGQNAVPAPNPWMPEAVDVARAFDFFDYAIVRAGPSLGAPYGAIEARAELLAAKGEWVGYRLRRPSAP